MELWINYLDQILLYAALALSLNLLLGYAGQVSVAHAAFGAIGGYAMAYPTQTHGWNFLLGTLLGMVLAFVIGSLVALPALKLSRRVPDPAHARGVVGDPRPARRDRRAGRHLRAHQPAGRRPLRLAPAAARATG